MSEHLNIASPRTLCTPRVRTKLTAMLLAAVSGFTVPAPGAGASWFIQPEIVPSPKSNPKDAPPEESSEPGQVTEPAAPTVQPAPAP
jgi:hypothetical protein